MAKPRSSDLGFVVTQFQKALNWAQSQSLWYTSTRGGCCADELLEAVSCRYDLERFGCEFKADPTQADLLIVTSAITYKSGPELLKVYKSMLEPKYVLAVGACASCGGPYSSDLSYSVIPGVDRIIPVDVYVPGCPPRPEAILNGLIALQEKIRGSERYHSQHQ